MKNLFMILAIGLIFLTACSTNQLSDNKTGNDSNIQIANPASEFCIEKGGKFELRTLDNGAQEGYCIINGKECEEWAFFRGQCTENYTVFEVLNDTCTSDSECSTPMNYLVRSSCPFTTICIEDKCNVVCPSFNGRDYEDVKECGSCPQYMPPSPDFCKNGRIIDGGVNDCGCQQPPKCDLIACTMDAKICDDGTAVGRTGPNCEFAPCP